MENNVSATNVILQGRGKRKVSTAFESNLNCEDKRWIQGIVLGTLTSLHTHYLMKLLIYTMAQHVSMNFEHTKEITNKERSSMTNMSYPNLR